MIPSFANGKRWERISKKNVPTRQHYVPRVYLKNFCDSSGEISAMNKHDHRIFSTGTKAICAENDFYTLEKMDDPYCWEHFYATSIEPLMGELFPKIISQSNILVQNGSVVIDEREKSQLAVLMIMQMFRGKLTREYERRLFQELLPEIIDEVKVLFGPLSDEQNQFLENYEKDDYYLKRTSMDVALNMKRMQKLSSVLYDRDFILLRIQGDMEFVTSDNPVMHINAVTQNVQPFTNGLLKLSTIVVYPISPKLMLYVTHPEAYFGMLSKYDGCLIDISGKSDSNFISTMNRKQMEQCANQIYARSQNTLRRTLK
ncbi:MAG: DUF4238 domain-containing protein [Lachnospiraceae bacterium]|nr:DUF4238 domain-containing protein [Lachnospiraceae bacterium]